MDRSSPSVAQSAAEIAGILVPRTAEMSADIYDLIVEEIPQLRADRGVLTLLDASVSENVATVLHILRHGIDTEQVHAPAAAQEYARRLAQRGVPIAALLRAYRIGSFRFQEWCLRELGQRSRDASLVSAAGLRIAETTSTYIDNVSEELVAAYETEKENWLRNLSATRAARVRAVLRGERVDIDSSETVLGYRLRQHHVGVVCWLDEAEAGAGGLARLEHAVTELARGTPSEGRPIFVPQDEMSAWAWLPLGSSASFAVDGVAAAVTEPGVRFAFGDAAAGLPGFRLTHRQAVGAHAVAVHATGSAAQRMTSFRDIAPLALMSGSADLFEGVPTMYGALLGHPKRSEYDVSALRVCVSGGAAMPVEIMRGFEQAFGCPVLEGYGLSETSPVASFNHPDRERKPGTIGTPIRGVDMRVVDGDRNEVPAGEPGEIEIRGHNVMKGYWRRPEATATAIVDGWFRTGDIGTIDDDGYFTIVDRKKDLIIRGGYSVYPREIEEVLYEHPDVAEAAVIGIPHPQLGEEVAAAVVVKRSASVTPDELREFVKGQVAAYKYPRRVWFVDALPTGPTGKILKREIVPPADPGER